MNAVTAMFATTKRWMLCFVVTASVAGCGGGAARGKSVASPRSDAASVTETSARSQSPGSTSPEEDPWAEDESDEAGRLVHRPLTEEEKLRFIAAYEEQKEEAFDEARKKRDFEDRLTRGMHQRELKKIEATLRAATRRIRRARTGKERNDRAVETALASAEEAAQLARERALRSRDAAFKAAARLEERLRQAAITQFEDNCRQLDSATIADYFATTSP